MIPVAANAPAWAHELARRIDLEIQEQGQQPVLIPSYSATDLPDVSRFRHRWIYVADESGGAVPAFSDGTAWRRCTDRVEVS